MKGGRCTYCENLIETDNDEYLCNDCLSVMNKATAPGRAIILAIIIISVIMLFIIL